MDGNAKQQHYVTALDMEHTDLMNELVEELEERGCQIFIERQNSFRVESTRSGVVVGGTPDIIAIHPDGRTVIYDAKTGQESASYIAQVQLYMYLLPKSQLIRWSGKKFEGAVVYADGSERRISADSMDDAFVSRLTEFMRKMTSHMPPRRVPSLAECGWCELDQRRLPRAHGALSKLARFRNGGQYGAGPYLSFMLLRLR